MQNRLWSERETSCPHIWYSEHGLVRTGWPNLNVHFHRPRSFYLPPAPAPLESQSNPNQLLRDEVEIGIDQWRPHHRRWFCCSQWVSVSFIPPEHSAHVHGAAAGDTAGMTLPMNGLVEGWFHSGKSSLRSELTDRAFCTRGYWQEVAAATIDH